MSERRRHRVFLTKHTEYHLRDAECVGVRDRASGAWVLKHAALRLHALAVPEAEDGHDWVGQRIHFWGHDTDVLTSPILSVDRPCVDAVIDYVSQARAGEIHENPSARLKASLPPMAYAV